MQEWVEWAESIAYGPLDLKPRQFERLQPHELYAMLDGYAWRQEQRQTETAYWISHLLNISGKSLKRPVKLRDLLKPLRQKAPIKRDKKEDEACLKETFKNRLRKT